MASKCFALENTVNTVGVMGKGIALQFKKEFPHKFEVYLESCIGQKFIIGNLLLITAPSLLTGKRLIINFPTKHTGVFEPGTTRLSKAYSPPKK
ncbi:macro domain-containing protein [Mucilaginibacter phyllosphaerae]